MLGYLVDRSCLSVGTPSRYVEGCIVGISLLLVPLFLFPFCSRSIHRYTAIAARCLGSFSKELQEISLLDIKPPFNGPPIQIGFSNFFSSFHLPLPGRPTSKTVSPLLHAIGGSLRLPGSYPRGFLGESKTFKPLIGLSSRSLPFFFVFEPLFVSVFFW